MNATIQYYWRPGCPFCMALHPQIRALAEQTGAELVEHDIWSEDGAADAVRRVADGNETVPTVVVGDTALVNPGIAKVRTALAEADPEAAQRWPKPPLWQRILGA